MRPLHAKIEPPVGFLSYVYKKIYIFLNQII